MMWHRQRQGQGQGLPINNGIYLETFCLHFTQFCIWRQVRHPPYGPWEHVPPQVWTDQSNSAATQDEAEDEAEVCRGMCRSRWQ